MHCRPINENDPEFERLIAAHRVQLYGFVLAMVGNSHDAEDLLQQVCVMLWEKRDQFELGTNFLAWARRIARYRVLNHWRKESKRPEELQLLDEDLAQAVYKRSEEREREFARHRLALQACLEKLPERQRKVVNSHYFEGRSIAQIAQSTGYKSNAISQLLFRARAGLIACVQASFPSVWDEEL